MTLIRSKSFYLSDVLYQNWLAQAKYFLKKLSNRESVTCNSCDKTFLCTFLSFVAMCNLSSNEIRISLLLNILRHLCHAFILYSSKLICQVWINQGDIILIGLRDYQDSKADVILKYTPDEARNLKTYGEFPESVRITDTGTFVENDLDEDIEFGDDFSSEEEGDAVDDI